MQPWIWSRVWSWMWSSIAGVYPGCGLGSSMDWTWMSLGHVPGWPGNRWLLWDENQTRVAGQWSWSHQKLFRSWSCPWWSTLLNSSIMSIGVLVSSRNSLSSRIVESHSCHDAKCVHWRMFWGLTTMCAVGRLEFAPSFHNVSNGTESHHKFNYPSVYIDCLVGKHCLNGIPVYQMELNVRELCLWFPVILGEAARGMLKLLHLEVGAVFMACEKHPTPHGRRQMVSSMFDGGVPNVHWPQDPWHHCGVLRLWEPSISDLGGFWDLPDLSGLEQGAGNLNQTKCLPKSGWPMP